MSITGSQIAEANKTLAQRGEKETQRLLLALANKKERSPEETAQLTRIVTSVVSQNTRQGRQTVRPDVRRYRGIGGNPSPEAIFNANIRNEGEAALAEQRMMANAAEAYESSGKEQAYVAPVTRLKGADGQNIVRGVVASEGNRSPQGWQRTSSELTPLIGGTGELTPEAVASLTELEARRMLDMVPEQDNPAFFLQPDTKNRAKQLAGATGDAKSALITLVVEQKIADGEIRSNREADQLLRQMGYGQASALKEPPSWKIDRALDIIPDQYAGLPPEALPEKAKQDFERAMAYLQNYVEPEPIAKGLSRRGTQEANEAAGGIRNAKNAFNSEPRGAGNVLEGRLSPAEQGGVPIVLLPRVQENDYTRQRGLDGQPLQVWNKDERKFDLGLSNMQTVFIRPDQQLNDEVVDKLGLDRVLEPLDRVQVGTNDPGAGVPRRDVASSGGFELMADPGNRSYWTDGKRNERNPTVAEAMMQIKNQSKMPITAFPASDIRIAMDEGGKEHFMAGGQEVFPIVDRPLSKALAQGGSIGGMIQGKVPVPQGSNYLRVNQDGQVVADMRVGGAGVYRPEMYGRANELVNTLLQAEGVINPSQRVMTESTIKNPETGAMVTTPRIVPANEVPYGIAVNSPKPDSLLDRYQLELLREAGYGSDSAAQVLPARLGGTRPAGSSVPVSTGSAFFSVLDALSSRTPGVEMEPVQGGVFGAREAIQRNAVTDPGVVAAPLMAKMIPQYNRGITQPAFTRERQGLETAVRDRLTAFAAGEQPLTPLPQGLKALPGDTRPRATPEDLARVGAMAQAFAQRQAAPREEMVETVRAVGNEVPRSVAPQLVDTGEVARQLELAIDPTGGTARTYTPGREMDYLASAMAREEGLPVGYFNRPVVADSPAMAPASALAGGDALGEAANQLALALGRNQVQEAAAAEADPHVIRILQEAAARRNAPTSIPERALAGAKPVPLRLARGQRYFNA